MLACNLDVLHFYRAKARERDPGGGELAWRMRGKKAWHRAKARERDPRRGRACMANEGKESLA